MVWEAAVKLGEFQDVFSRELLPQPEVPVGDSALGSVVRQPGFAVYRNTVIKGCIDALQGNFPAVAHLVGEEWFRAAAAQFVADQPPRHTSLVDYGGEFPNFLTEFEPAAMLPYLGDIARLDRFWTEAHIAPDDPVVSASALASLPTGAFERVVLRPHASARWSWFEQAPILSIWRATRDLFGDNAPRDIHWCGEGALCVRPHHIVRMVSLDRAGCAFLDACGAGCSVVQAGLDALAATPGVDLSGLMQTLLGSGVFARIDVSDNERDISHE